MAKRLRRGDVVDRHAIADRLRKQQERYASIGAGDLGGLLRRADALERGTTQVIVYGHEVSAEERAEQGLDGSMPYVFDPRTGRLSEWRLGEGIGRGATVWPL